MSKSEARLPEHPEEARRELAEQRLAEWLSRSGSLESLDIEALCAAEPTLADELRAAWRDCQQVGALLEALASGSLIAGGSSATRARARPEASGSDPATGALVKRLEASRPARSRYELVGEVGRGGMGAIFEVWDEDLQRRLAMKVALGEGATSGGTPRSAQEARRLGRFVEEAQVTGQLEHPGVVPVHELGLDAEGRLYFTMPLLRGDDLRRVYEKVRKDAQGWSVTRTLHVLLRVCETLAYAHHRGVVHRDLKPANVMVGNFGEAYVMDWGLARVAGRPDAKDIRLPEVSDASSLRTLRRSLTEDSPDSPLVTNDGDVVGTPSYMPPEQARGEIDAVDQRADVYAVGAMLYELFAGRPPYQPTGSKLSARTVLVALLEGPPKPLHELAPEVPPELEAIVEKAMQRERNERYAGVRELADDLRAYLEHRVVRAYETGAWAELRKWVGRNRAVAASVAAAIVVAMGASALIAWRESEKKRALGELNVALERERDEKVALSDVMTTRVLLDEFDAFGPDDEGLAGMRRWIERAEDVLSRGAAGIEANAPGIAATERQEHRARLEELAPRLSRQRERLQANAGVRALSLEQHAAEWERCALAVESAPVYGGLELAPQSGLVPLRVDEDSGLWEFWHVASGERPDFDETARGYRLSPATGIVLVLLPAGEFDMGSPFGEPGRGDNETQHREEVAPFFLAKHELTQAQWRRAMDSNPSFQPAGSRMGESVTTELHPVETISWPKAMTCARLLGLRLPTEAEWEYAARAGSDAAFSYGPEPDELEGRENLGDQSSIESYWIAEDRVATRPAPWKDGFPGTAPVASFEPNYFGLFDMYGNVGEWTSTEYEGDYGAPRSQAPALGHTEERLVRGGNSVFGPISARLASRQAVPPGNASRIVGMRAARDLTQ